LAAADFLAGVAARVLRLAGGFRRQPAGFNRGARRRIVSAMMYPLMFNVLTMLVLFDEAIA